jgi:hypothetical protein
MWPSADETWQRWDAEIAIGDTLKLELSENPTTGYRWRMPDVGPAVRLEAWKQRGHIRRWTLAAEADFGRRR